MLIWRNQNRGYIMLGIETTCDDTGVAVVTEDRRILSNIRHTQADQHEPYGGVFPRLAADLHKERLPLAFNEAIEASGLSMSDIDAIAVAKGPGLAPSLREGLLFSNKLGLEYGKKLFGVHHMEAHSLVTRLENSDLDFPFISLLISGGHTLIVIQENVGVSFILGSTLDDSIGETFDKVSGFLGLKWVPGEADTPRSGGAALELCAAHGNGLRFRLPIPMKGTKNCNFSFSGLKTAVKRLVEAQQESLQDPQIIADIAAAFQHSCIEHLCDRLERALELCKKRSTTQTISTLVAAGGVACNQAIRTRYVPYQS